MKRSLFLISGYVLFFVQVGCSQVLKIGLNGFERRFSMSSSNISGPLVLNTQDYWYSGGIEFTYEREKNGFQLSIIGLPYKVDLRFKNIIGGVNNGNTIAVYGLSYRRELFYWQRRRVTLYTQAGIGIGSFQHKGLDYPETHNINLNGNIIYSSTLNRESLYDKSFILLPILKLDLEKKVFSNLIISAQASYIFNNFFSYHIPLEQGNYQYTYNGQNGSGHLADYGSGFLFGVGLKYQIKLY